MNMELLVLRTDYMSASPISSLWSGRFRAIPSRAAGGQSALPRFARKPF